MPVATTLKEMSSLMGSRVGVKHWRDFAFFQATGKAESLRHEGRLHSKPRVLLDATMKDIFQPVAGCFQTSFPCRS